MELITLISSVLADMLAAGIMADANKAAASLLGVIGLMALLPDCNRETQPRGNGMPAYHLGTVKARLAASAINRPAKIKAQ